MVIFQEETKITQNIRIGHNRSIKFQVRFVIVLVTFWLFFRIEGVPKSFTGFDIMSEREKSLN